MMRVLVVNFLILLLGIVILEVFFGDWWINNNLFLTRIPRDIEIKFQVNELYDGPDEIRYTRDKYGFRGKYEDVSTINILTVGGSTTDQRFIDDEQTWQKYLQDYLTEAKGKNITVVNAGIDGQTTYGHIENFEYWWTYIPNLRSEYILFYISLNDSGETTSGYLPPDNNTETASGPNGKYDAAVRPADDESFSLKEVLMTKSAIYNAWLNLNGLRVAKKAGVGHQATAWQAVTWHPISDAEWDNSLSTPNIAKYEARIKRLIELTESIGSKAIIVNQRSFLSKNSNTGRQVFTWDEGYPPLNTQVMYARAEREYADKTYQTCLELRAICIDLLNDLSEEFNEVHFYDSMHNTPAGTKLIGNYLGEKLAPLLEFNH